MTAFLLTVILLLLLLASHLSLIVASTLVPVLPLPAAHIILIAGQSNSVGLNSDPFTTEDAIVDRIWQLQVSQTRQAQQWRLVKPGTNDSSTDSPCPCRTACVLLLHRRVLTGPSSHPRKRT